MNRVKEILNGVKQNLLSMQRGNGSRMMICFQNRQQPRLEILFEIPRTFNVNPKNLFKADLNG